jgi:FixJ family two-component response regulator
MNETDAIVFVVDDDAPMRESRTSETTVKIHRHQVMEKMEAGSLPELVRMADRLGILVLKS